MTLNPQSLAILEWTSSLLNNSGDSVSLIAPDGQTAFEVAFSECSAKGNSFIYYDNDWRETMMPTKGASNQYTDPEDTSVIPDDQDEETDKEIEADKLAANQLPSATFNFPLSTPFEPPLNLSGLVLGASTTNESVNQDANHSTIQPFSHNNSDGRMPIANVILGGLIMTGSSTWSLIDWWHKLPKQ